MFRQRTSLADERIALCNSVAQKNYIAANKQLEQSFLQLLLKTFLGCRIEVRTFPTMVAKMKTPSMKSTIINAYSASVIGSGRSAMVVIASVDQKNAYRYMRLNVALTGYSSGSML